MFRISHIPVNDCVDGGFYRVWARNFTLSIYDAKNHLFIGIRTKMTSKFLDKEYHYDSPKYSAQYRTARPLTFISSSIVFSSFSTENVEIKRFLEQNDFYSHVHLASYDSQPDVVTHCGVSSRPADSTMSAPNGPYTLRPDVYMAENFYLYSFEGDRATCPDCIRVDSRITRYSFGTLQ